MKSIKEELSRTLREETMAERTARILPGVAYGFFAATVYILVLSAINVLTFPGMHLGFDWAHILPSWLGFGLGLAAAGAIVGWFTEGYSGVIWGGILMTILVILVNFIVALFSGENPAKMFQSVLILLPLVGGAVLLTWGLRYLIQRHVQIIKIEEPRQRRKKLAGLIGLVFLIACLPGVFSRYDTSTAKMLGELNQLMQNGGTDTVLASRYLPAQLPGLKDHFGQPYTIYIRPSFLTVNALDINVRFDEGYSFVCVIYTSSGDQTYFTSCNEGNQIISQ